MKSCLEQHPICHANCCRQVKISLNEPLGERSILAVKGFLTKDMQWYWRLRGCTYDSRRGITFFHLSIYDIEEHDGYLILHRDCKLLKGNLCVGHPDKKPEFCKIMDVNNPSSVTSKMYVTKGCLLDCEGLK